jgi:phosphoglycerate dehydrogenase-like enzyme
MTFAQRPLVSAALLFALLPTVRPALAADVAPTAAKSSGATAEEIGSLRNARVAIAVPDKKTELTFFVGSISDAEKAELAKLAPNVRIVSGLSPQQALARAEEAHGIDARYASPEFLSRAKNLVWVQSMSAGVERYLALDEVRKNDKIVLTNGRGVHGPAIADHTLAMLLSLTRHLGDYSQQIDERDPGKEGGHGPVALEGRTMLVVGVGGIGSEIAKRAHGFGMRVIGTRRSAAPLPQYFEKVGLSGDLLSLLPEADVVAIAVPLTPETENLFDAKAFAAMKPGSYLLNIGRGKVVDTGALLSAVSSGKLAGAGLDVTEPEPLPADHPLRKLPNVIITPHVAAVAELTDTRRNVLLKENLRRFGAGEPLLNVVDKQAGY